MKITDSEINEKFLLHLLDTVDVVYHSKTVYENHLYFYPKGLGFTIKIPLTDSKHVNINFCKDNNRNREDDIINLEIPSFDSVKNFFNELYKKHEILINNSKDYEKYQNLFDDFLKTPIKNLPKHTTDGKDDTLRLIFNTEEQEIIFCVGRALLNYDDAKKYKPLEPIKLELFWKNKGDSKNNFFTKIIPAFELKEYPILQKYSGVIPSCSNIHNLLEILSANSDKKENLGALHSFILDVELSNKEEFKNHKPKI